MRYGLAVAVKTYAKPVRSSTATARLIEELDRVRRARGESKAEVARGAGLGEPAVRRLFSNRHANPTIKTLEAVAEHLGLQLALESQSDVVTSAHGRMRHIHDEAIPLG